MQKESCPKQEDALQKLDALIKFVHAELGNFDIAQQFLEDVINFLSMMRNLYTSNQIDNNNIHIACRIISTALVPLVKNNYKYDKTKGSIITRENKSTKREK